MVNNDIRLSIGVPVYNQVSTIRATLLSVLSQNTAPFEVVVSENYSTDGTDKILEEFSPRIRIVRPSSHLGMTENWNFCVSQMKGNWFALISGDDLAKPCFVEELTKAAGSVEDAVLVRGDWENINAAGDVIESRRLLSVRKIIRPPQTWLEQLEGPKLSFAAFALKRSVWQQVGGFPVGISLIGDWAMWLKIAPFGAFVHAPHIVSQYRVIPRPDLDVGRIPATIKDEYTILFDVIAPYFKESNPLLPKLAAARLKGLLNYVYRQGAPQLSDASINYLTLISRVAGNEDFLNEWLVRPEVIPDSLGRRMCLGVKKIGRVILNLIHKVRCDFTSVS